MITSMLYKVTRKLLSLPSALLRSDAAKDAELLVLRHENAVLRRQLAVPVRNEADDRFWFAALSGLIPRRRWHEAFPVTPDTLLGWHRRFNHREVGRHCAQAHRSATDRRSAEEARTTTRQRESAMVSRRVV